MTDHPSPPPSCPQPLLDLLVVGAGLAGIGAAAEYRRAFPHKRLAILESRDRIGGTWDLFRYPGVRSDTDMFTLGYRIRPWRGQRAMMDGPSIREYITDTAREHGVLPLIRFHQRVQSLDWSSVDREWQVTICDTRSGQTQRLRARFVHLCTGYYSYAEGYRPSFPGESDYRGQFVHPQFWPEDLDYADKRVVVIGSGATAVTLVPKLAERAAKVTQLQRSPTYIVTQPALDPVARRLDPWLPAAILYPLVRWKCILVGVFQFALARAMPKLVARRIVAMAAEELPAGYAVQRHFAPTYGPWDQRICAVPDGDLFKAVSTGKADIVTDQIDTFVPEGIRLASGATLQADIVVTATGLKVMPLGGATVRLDGSPVQLADTMVYRGAMLSGIPNLVLTIGYTNASWTLRADLIAQYVVRLVRRLDREQKAYAVAERDPRVAEQPLLDFSSGYVQRASDVLPKQGDRFPWRVHQNYLKDLFVTRYRRLADPALRFRGVPADPAAAPQGTA